jgi:hypothetical protein
MKHLLLGKEQPRAGRTEHDHEEQHPFDDR